MSTTLQRPQYLDNRFLPVYKKKPEALLDVDWGSPKKSYLNDQIRYIEKSAVVIIFNIQEHEFNLPYELSHIKASIIKSEYILELKDDWDEEDALATNFEAFIKAVKFIVDYSTYIFRDKERVIIDSPDIDILSDGSIVVNWETQLGSFTIIFNKTPNEISYYYAKEKNDQIPLRHGVNTNRDIDKTTAQWMSSNLK